MFRVDHEPTTRVGGAPERPFKTPTYADTVYDTGQFFALLPNYK